MKSNTHDNLIAIRIDPSNIDVVEDLLAGVAIVLDTRPTCSQTKLNLVVVFTNKEAMPWIVSRSIIEDVSAVEFVCNVRKLVA